MIPARFVVEFPERCLALIDAMEPEARKRSLLGSFSLMIAPSLFMVPYERMRNSHDLQEARRERGLYSALKRINKQKFLKAEYWNGATQGEWRQFKVMGNIERTDEWVDEHGNHPMHGSAHNEIASATVDKVIRVIRNALAHGNIIYLDETGFEREGAQVQYLAFISRYDDPIETCPDCGRKRERIVEGVGGERPTHRVVTVTEEGFLAFLRFWASWLQQFKGDWGIREAA